MLFFACIYYNMLNFTYCNNMCYKNERIVLNELLVNKCLILLDKLLNIMVMKI